MFLFLGGILFLIAGYFIYGRFVEKILDFDDRQTPCQKHFDGVDFVPLPRWKNMLIQLLNIAGIGPVIGVIVGVKFGRIALLIIPLGCVFMGAVHDFLAGVISLRSAGSDLPRIVHKTLGKPFSQFFSYITVFCLALFVTVLVNIPSAVIDKAWLPDISFFWIAVVLIMLYYIFASIFPVDKIIGSIYPIFGGMLILGTFAIFVSLIVSSIQNPELLTESAAFLQYHNDVFAVNNRSPIFPLLFVTIACGIISGFHATQCPIVARTMTSYSDSRLTFFGMMIAEGIIAMVWAAAALAIYNIDPSNLTRVPAEVLNEMTSHFLGKWIGYLTIIAVVVLAITSGDTALRSCRMSLAEIFSIKQKKIASRILITLPIIVLVLILLWWSNRSKESFNELWHYFAWGNQVIAAITLLASTVWLLRKGSKFGALITLLPGVFMTAVVVSFILWTSSDKGQPEGFGLPLCLSNIIACCVALALGFYVYMRGRHGIYLRQSKRKKKEK